MSDIPSQNTQTLFGLNRLNNKFEEQGNQLNDFMGSQARGESPDPEMFAKLLEQRSVTHQAMQAQFKLYEKPLKTVMTEAK